MEHSGIALFSVEKSKNAEDELNVLFPGTAVPSISTYCISLLLFAVFVYNGGNSVRFVFPIIVKSPLTLYTVVVGVVLEVLGVKGTLT